MLSHPIGRKRPFRTIYAFAAWQAKSRLRSGSHVVPFVNAARLVVDPHEHGTTANIYVGLREFESMGVVIHGLRPGDTFIDVGANVGTFVVLAAAVAGTRVIAVEPVSETAGRLWENVQLNGCTDRVELRRVAAGAERSSVTMIVDDGATNRVAAPADVAGHRTRIVHVLPLDEIVGNRKATILKIDVEGLEMDVLRGAAALLSDPGLLAVMVETNGSGESYGQSDGAILELLGWYGFHMTSYDPWTRELRHATALSSADNTIFVRQETDLGIRLRDAPRCHVRGFYI